MDDHVLLRYAQGHYSWRMGMGADLLGVTFGTYHMYLTIALAKKGFE